MARKGTSIDKKEGHMCVECMPAEVESSVQVQVPCRLVHLLSGHDRRTMTHACTLLGNHTNRQTDRTY